MLQMWTAQEDTHRNFDWKKPVLVDISVGTDEATDTFQNMVFGDHVVN